MVVGNDHDNDDNDDDDDDDIDDDIVRIRMIKKRAWDPQWPKPLPQ